MSEAIGAPRAASALRARPPEDLTCPRALDTARRVFSASLAVRLGRLGQLPLTRLGPRAQGDARRALAAVQALVRTDAGAVAHAYRRTGVTAPLEAARVGGVSDETLERWVMAGLTTLLAELAHAEALRDPVTVTSPVAEIVLRSACATVRVARGAPITFSAGAITQSGGDLLAGARAARDAHVPLAEGIALACVDDNPLAENEAHPDKHGNALDLGDAPLDAWRAALVDALGCVEAHLPMLRAEMTLGVQQVVPVGTDRERHLSATYREALGTLYVSLHPDPLTMAEALVHEFQHTKLNAVLDVDPLLENAFEARVSSPVRPDLRPLHGVLLAVHAFLPVAALHASLARAGDPIAARPAFVVRARQVCEGNARGLAALREHAHPTSLGRVLLDEMAALQAESEAFVAGLEQRGGA